MKHWTIITILALSLCSCGQTASEQPEMSKSPDEQVEMSKSTLAIVKDIEKVNMLMGNAVGYAGVKPAQYDNFMELRKKATTPELIELTDHPNATVRCYAFWALTYDSTINLFPIVLDHIGDSATVETQFGCTIMGERVGDFFISMVTPQYNDPEANKLDSIQLAALDSALIFSSNELWAKSTAIRRVEPTENMYPKIRELVVNEQHPQALVTLAKYQREQDVQLILNFQEQHRFKENGFGSTYRAISLFPHPDFMPLLEKNLNKTLDKPHYSSEWRGLYKAIASYKNEKAVDLLKVPFTKVEHLHIKGYHLDYVFGAVGEYKDDLYEDLMWKLWKDYGRIDAEIFEFLMERDANRAFGLAGKSLKNSDNYHSRNTGINSLDYEAAENLTSTMLDLILKQDRDFGIDLVIKNLRDANVHLFPIFAEKAKEMRHESFVEPLFSRLKTEWNANIYLEIAKALVAYQDEAIYERIIATRKKNEKLNSGWGGEALERILKENDIK